MSAPRFKTWAQLDADLAAERTARETAERERDEAKQEAAARLKQTLGQSRAYEQAIREWKSEVARLTSKLAALEAQTKTTLNITQTAHAILNISYDLSPGNKLSEIESILTRLQAEQSVEVTQKPEPFRVELIEANSKLARCERERDSLRSQLEASRAECERLDQLINSPELIDFQKAVILEAAHQRERWGSDHDAGKTPADWFWLVGYVAGKALSKPDKRLHHIITTAAVCANWHAAELGLTDMRPGISADKTEAIDAMQPAPDAIPAKEVRG